MTNPQVDPQVEFGRRMKRFYDCVELRKPDQIPISPLTDMFPARYAGIPIDVAMHDHDKMFEAWMKYQQDFDPDMFMNPYAVMGFANIFNITDFQQVKWAGHGLKSNRTFQFVEMELLKADEYDHFISDMSDFMVRRFYPRIHKNLAPLEKLPPLNSQISYYSGVMNFAAFADPEIQGAMEVMKQAGGAAMGLIGNLIKMGQTMAGMGVPGAIGCAPLVPFDMLGNFFRGTNGLMTDLRRRPEKVIAACEMLLPNIIKWAINDAKMSRTPIAFIAMHKGNDRFISQDQFLKFYWPHLKIMVDELIKEGITPWLFAEGVCDQRMETFADVPPGKVIYHLEASDIFRAKKILREVACLRGNMPLSIMSTGGPDDVRAYAKKLIDEVGEDGGFMMDTSTTIDDAKPENLRALFDYTREFGRY